MTVYKAIVQPLQPWGKDGRANVWITDDNLNISTNLPLENRKTSTTQTTIAKTQYTEGLIRINKDHLPTTPTVELDVEVTTESQVTHQDWPNGGILFL